LVEGRAKVVPVYGSEIVGGWGFSSEWGDVDDADNGEVVGSWRADGRFYIAANEYVQLIFGIP
jgi:hypothetical protein